MTKEKDTLAQDIIEGLEETLNFLRGEKTGGMTTYYINGTPLKENKVAPLVPLKQEAEKLNKSPNTPS